MRCHVTGDAAEFLDRAGGFLASRPVEHNLVLSLAELARGDHGTTGRWTWTTDPDGQVCGALIQTPASYTATLTPMPPQASEALVARLASDAPDLPGVTGEAGTVARFAGHWASACSVPAQPIAAQRLYRLGPLHPPGKVAGTLRQAKAAEVPTLVEWDESFATETGLTRPAGVDRTAVIGRRVDEGMWWVWDIGQHIVSMAFSSPPLAGAARVGAVYTPPEHRGHGYAGALVAEISTHLLAIGLSDCLLYTQLTNPTSNRIYQRIGYRPVADILAYRFG